MASSVETLVERVLGELHRIVQTETVIGEPFQAGDLTIIPVSKISFGFGAGGGLEGKGQSGTGGGANIEPIAFLIVDAERQGASGVHRRSGRRLGSDHRTGARGHRQDQEVRQQEKRQRRQGRGRERLSLFSGDLGWWEIS